MSTSEQMLDRIREALADQPDVEEKKMFNGICFMVNGKMCVCSGKGLMLCRIGEKQAKAVIEQHGVRQMVMRGKPMKDYVQVDESTLRTKKELEGWVRLALNFNKEAKSSKKK
jgi:TfoX/Sxy family transcriptional regulator of competence genes